MPYTKLSFNGQVILPKSVRDQLGLKQGMSLRVWTDGRAVILEPAEKRTWRKLRGILKGTEALKHLELEHRREFEADP